MKQVVIIGNGIAGITAARHIRKRSNYGITVISGESDHFYSRTALMYLYMGHMEYHHLKPYEDWFWPKNRITLVRDWVQEIDTSNKKLKLQNNPDLAYDILIIATGSKPRKGGWSGEEAPNVHGLYGLQDLAMLEENTKGLKEAVIVGGGLIGVELAEMLHSRHIPVSLLVRETDYWSGVLPQEEAAMVSKHIRMHGINLKLNTQLKEILHDEKGRARAVITDRGEEITCQFVGVTIGVVPNISFLKNSEIKTDRGVLVDRYFRTNAPDVYAIGDCAQHKESLPGRKPVEQVWYTGRIHGETVAATVCGSELDYKPGPWFNSAKFFDLEYQVYGEVADDFAEDEKHLFWQHPKGDQSIRMVWDAKSGKVKGFNLMGVRYRHEVCERWIKSGATIDEVMVDLHKANFDPEFYKRYESQVIELYLEVAEKEKLPKKKKSFWNLLFK